MLIFKISYCFYQLKTIKELRQDIILAGRRENSYAAVVGDRYAGTSIVERRATKLADSLLLREMERITKAIEDTYARAKEEGRRVIWVKYGLAIGWEPPAELAAHRYRTGFVYGVADWTSAEIAQFRNS